MYYETLISEDQNGFRKGRSCADGYFTLKLILEKRREYNLETHFAFIDYKKAFEKLNRDKLLHILKEDNVPNYTLQAIFRDIKIDIKIDEEITDFKSINAGVRQGCPLSPRLFVVYMNSMIKKGEINAPIEDIFPLLATLK